KRIAGYNLWQYSSSSPTLQPTSSREVVDDGIQQIGCIEFSRILRLRSGELVTEERSITESDLNVTELLIKRTRTAGRRI
ncbi:MAG TPA: hypothetical protein VFQ43_17290, partial [Nitrososphaera sp.]|nr:hypothetical protein [Nitrososphaera sp.]